MKTRTSKNRSLHRGGLAYTLAEVLIAVILIAILFVTLYRGVAFCFSVTRSERENLRATQVILRRMEGIRLFNWNQLTNTALNPTTFYEEYLPGSPASGVTYTGRVEVSSVTLDPPATYSTNMRKITVTISWSSGAVVHTRQASTYVSRDGVQNYIYSN
jgi:type II secretory pathway pseudopilin PulG